MPTLLQNSENSNTNFEAVCFFPIKLVIDHDLSALEAYLFGIIYDHFSRQRKFYWTSSHLAEELKSSTATIQRAIKKLIDCSLIQSSLEPLPEADSSHGGKRTVRILKVNILNLKPIDVDEPAQELFNSNESNLTLSPVDKLKPLTLSKNDLDLIKTAKPDNILQINNIKNIYITLPNFPLIQITEEQHLKLLYNYKAVGLSHKITDAFEELSAWASENPRKFARKKNHYRCLIGWVKNKFVAEATSETRLTRERAYLAQAQPQSRPIPKAPQPQAPLPKASPEAVAKFKQGIADLVGSTANRLSVKK